MALVPYTGEILKEKPLNLVPYTGEILQKPPVQEQEQGPKVLSQEDDSSDFFRAIKNAIPQNKEIFGGSQLFTGLALQRLGAEETGKELVKSGVERIGRAEKETVSKKSDEFMEALKMGIGTLLTDWLPYQIGSGVANVAETLAFMGVGAGLGAVTGAGVGALPGAISTVLAENMVKQGIKEMAKKIAKEQGVEQANKFVIDEAKKTLIKTAAKDATVLGLGAQAGLHGTGEVTSRALQEAQKRGETAEDIELKRVAPAAVMHAVADYFVNKIGVNALKIDSKLTGSFKEGLIPLVTEIGKRIGTTGIKELPGEEIQTLAERLGAKLSIADAEALKEYVNTAAASMGMAVVPGGVGGARTYYSNKNAAAELRYVEEERKAKEEADAKAAAKAAAEAAKVAKTTGAPPAAGAAPTTPGAPPVAPSGGALGNAANFNALVNATPGAATTTTTAPPTGTTPPPTGAAPISSPQAAAVALFNKLAADPANSFTPVSLNQTLGNLTNALNVTPDPALVDSIGLRRARLTALGDYLTANNIQIPELEPILGALPKSGREIKLEEQAKKAADKAAADAQKAADKAAKDAQKAADKAAADAAKAAKASTPPATPAAVTPDAVANAMTYINSVDAGTALKQTEIRQVATALGLKIKPGTNVAAFDSLKNFVAGLDPNLHTQAFEIIQQRSGAPNAPTGTNAPSVGTSIGVATQPGAGPATQGATAPNANGVGNAPSGITATNVGKGTQPTSVKSETELLAEEHAADLAEPKTAEGPAPKLYAPLASREDLDDVDSTLADEIFAGRQDFFQLIDSELEKLDPNEKLISSRKRSLQRLEASVGVNLTQDPRESEGPVLYQQGALFPTSRVDKAQTQDEAKAAFNAALAKAKEARDQYEKSLASATSLKGVAKNFINNFVGASPTPSTDPYSFMTRAEPVYPSAEVGRNYRHMQRYEDLLNRELQAYYNKFGEYPNLTGEQTQKTVISAKQTGAKGSVFNPRIEAATYQPNEPLGQRQRSIFDPRRWQPYFPGARTEGENRQIGITLARQLEEREEEDRLSKLEEAKAKREKLKPNESWTPLGTPAVRDLYNQISKEQQAEAEIHNKRVEELEAEHEKLEEEHSKAENLTVTLERKIAQAKKDKNEELVKQLDAEHYAALSKEIDIFENLTAVEKRQTDHGQRIYAIPDWTNISPSEKKIFFDQVTNINDQIKSDIDASTEQKLSNLDWFKLRNIGEYRKAGRVLQKYRAIKTDRAKGYKTFTDTQNKLKQAKKEGDKAAIAALEKELKTLRAIAELEDADENELTIAYNYEENRKIVSKLFGFEFPSWNKLSIAGRANFVRNSFAESGGLEQDVAYFKLAEFLLKESNVLPKDIQDKLIAAQEKGDKKEIAKLTKELKEARNSTVLKIKARAITAKIERLKDSLKLSEGRKSTARKINDEAALAREDELTEQIKDEIEELSGKNKFEVYDRKANLAAESEATRKYIAKINREYTIGNSSENPFKDMYAAYAAVNELLNQVENTTDPEVQSRLRAELAEKQKVADEAAKRYNEIINKPANKEVAREKINDQIQAAKLRLIDHERRMINAATEQEKAEYQALIEQENQLVEGFTEELANLGMPSREVFQSRSRLPEHVINQINANNLQGVLQYLRTQKGSVDETGKSVNTITAALGQILFDMKLQTQIKIVERLPSKVAEGTDALGAYDPMTDTIYLTKAGLDDSTILHETVHAATIQVLYKYLSGKAFHKDLTATQLKAAAHLENIMEQAKQYLGESYPNAFENLYEFVSYSMTDRTFQEELLDISYSAQGAAFASEKIKKFESELQKKLKNGEVQLEPVGNSQSASNWASSTIIGSILKKSRSLWSDFTRTIADIIGYDPKEFNKNSAARQQAKIPKVVTIEGERYLLKQGKSIGGLPAEINLFLEVAEAFNQILTVPRGGFDISQLQANAPNTPKQAQKNLRTDVDIFDDKSKDYAPRPEREETKGKTFVSRLLSVPTLYKTAVYNFQNDRVEVKTWQEMLTRANKIVYDVVNQPDLYNAISTAITLATSLGKNNLIRHVRPLADNLNKSLSKYAKAEGIDTDTVLKRIHKIMEGLHEPERRMVKYLLIVPLSKVANIQAGTNRLISAADLRQDIIHYLNTRAYTEQELANGLDKTEAEALRAKLESIVFTTDAAGNRVPNLTYVDKKGSSPRISDKMNRFLNSRYALVGGWAGMEIDINHDTYNVTGMTPAASAAVRAQYQNMPNKDLIDDILNQVQQLHKVTTELNKEANYWSQPVSNRVFFYGYKHYVPLKGTLKPLAVDTQLDFDSLNRGREHQEFQPEFGGRESVSDNPLQQSIIDASRAATRAGRKNVTLAIKNAINQGLIKGARFKDPVPFEERGDREWLNSIPRGKSIFHYNTDGSIEVFIIEDPKMRESIRRTYRDTSPVWKIANDITSAIGAIHTRYNFNFAPLNFVRDALTNTFAIGADMGPKEAAEFIKQISSIVAQGGLVKAMRVAVLHQSLDPNKRAEYDRLAKFGDAHTRAMIEFLNKGGMVSYTQALSLKENFSELEKEIGKNRIVSTVQGLNRFLDLWTDMFEVASRSAAYMVAKQNAVKEGLSREAAQEKAADYAKNLANFEQVGKYGKILGSLYMFFRPSATGAVRAIQSVAPAFDMRSWDTIKLTLPETIRDDPVASATYRKNYMKQQANARIMTASLMGAGMLAYTMAYMMSDDDDDLGRNPVLTDNMQQWTRFARFHIPRSITEAMGLNKPVIIQIPWGFGLGAFAASGAQMASAIAGQQPVKEALANIFLQISLDSFVPIPISRMPPTEMPLEFFLDSIMPSVIRPVLEFALNKNGLGQDIYNDQNRRMGDAYTGGDRIPQIYKDASRWVANSSIGSFIGVQDVSPNTLYFLSNSYADGAARMFIELPSAVYNMSSDRKTFDPKTDLPLFGSFFGSKSNVDSREFSKVESQILDMKEKIKMFDTSPLMAARYDMAYPFNRALVEMYDKDVNGELRDLRAEAKRIRLDENMSPKTQESLLKVMTYHQNLIKHNLIMSYRAYGVEP